MTVVSRAQQLQKHPHKREVRDAWLQQQQQQRSSSPESDSDSDSVPVSEQCNPQQIPVYIDSVQE
ncbi:GL24155 [Drosophila persimilis]|uniref:GL24155 n=1 Tax=Drosophila persimilis TaxID=7234 RepID=B4G439_DROPE|nr:GL24155 [Drosophila persimilis]